jgi:hypothetical protein
VELISYPVDIATKITKFPANSYECPQFFCLLNVETQNNQEKHRQQWAPTNRFYTNLKLLQVGICTLIKLLPKSRKIHWVLDNISVVGQLNKCTITHRSISFRETKAAKETVVFKSKPLHHQPALRKHHTCPSCRETGTQHSDKTVLELRVEWREEQEQLTSAAYQG